MINNIYEIIESIGFNYNDNYWQRFVSDSDSVIPAIILDCQKRAYDMYEVELLPSDDSHKLFCVSQSFLSIDKNFEHGTIYHKDKDDAGIYGCAMVALYGNLIRKKTLVIHSSLVEIDGSGILFTGPSGVGKTTQAELWHKHRNAEIINGDMSIIHLEQNEKFYAYGSPWHGSSEYCLNRKVPLKAIIAPIQSNRNSIKQISGIEMLNRVFPEVMLPDWFEGCKEYGMDTLDSMLRNIPVYLLECTKDEQAVEIAEKELGKLN